jgi:hypothetical protein
MVESLRTQNHTLLSYLKLPQTGSRIYIPQEQGGPIVRRTSVYVITNCDFFISFIANLQFTYGTVVLTNCGYCGVLLLLVIN